MNSCSGFCYTTLFGMSVFLLGCIFLIVGLAFSFPKYKVEQKVTERVMETGEGLMVLGAIVTLVFSCP